MARRHRDGRRFGAADAADDVDAAPATRTFSYAIHDHELDAIRPVLTACGSEEHRDEWVARAITIAQRAAVSAAQPMVWEAELGPAGAAMGPYVLVYAGPGESGA